MVFYECEDEALILIDTPTSWTLDEGNYVLVTTRTSLTADRRYALRLKVTEQQGAPRP